MFTLGTGGNEGDFAAARHTLPGAPHAHRLALLSNLSSTDATNAVASASLAVPISACSSLYAMSGCWELEPYSARLSDTSAPNEEQRTSRGNAYQSLLKVCRPAPVSTSNSLLPREGMAAKTGDRRAPQYHAGVIKAKPEMIEQVEPGFMCCFTWLPPCPH